MTFFRQIIKLIFLIQSALYCRKQYVPPSTYHLFFNSISFIFQQQFFWSRSFPIVPDYKETEDVLRWILPALQVRNLSWGAVLGQKNIVSWLSLFKKKTRTSLTQLTTSTDVKRCSAYFVLLFPFRISCLIRSELYHRFCFPMRWQSYVDPVFSAIPLFP